MPAYPAGFAAGFVAGLPAGFVARQPTRPARLDSPTMNNLLVTGFEPFGGETINPSWELARALNGEVIVVSEIPERRGRGWRRRRLSTLKAMSWSWRLPTPNSWSRRRTAQR